MITNNSYAKAYTEVLEIISYFSDEEYSKIPKEKIEFYKENMDKNYKFKINPQIDLAEQHISQEANAILIILFRDYFATEKQKEKLQYLLNQEQEEIEQKKREIYNPDNIFDSVKKENNKSEKVNNEVVEMIEYKENFFSRFKKFILKLLHLDI